MERRLVVTAALLCALMCGCEESGQSRSVDADIERTRLQIAAKSDEKQRLEAEVRKMDKLVPEHHKLETDYATLYAERHKLLTQLNAGTPPVHAAGHAK